MKFVILSNKPLPMYNGVHGPILTPAEYDIHLVLKFIAYGIDVREVMEDGSYRKLEYNDAKLIELLKEKNKENKKNLEAIRDRKKEIKNHVAQGNVRLKEERIKPQIEKPKKEKNKEELKKHEHNKEEMKQRFEEHKKEKNKEDLKKHEHNKEESKKNLIIDELEKPE